MSFGLLKFGEKCDRHPEPKTRGQDNRAHIMGAPRPNPAADKMQSSGDWFKPVPKEAPQVEMSTAQRAALRKQISSSGVSGVLQPEPQPEVRPAPSRPGTATTSSQNRPTSAKYVTPGNILAHYEPAEKKPLTEKEKFELQVATNVAAGLRIPENVPPPVNMNEVVQNIPQPKSRPPPAKEVSGVVLAAREAELESRLDGFVLTIRKYVETKSNFADKPGQSLTLQKLLKAHCNATTELRSEDFAAALHVFNLSMTEEERDALFDRFDTNESGTLSFREMAAGILGIDKVATQDAEVRGLLRDIKAKIIKRNPDDGAIRAFSRSFQLMNKEKDENLNSDEIFNGLQKMGIRVQLQNIERLVKAFDTTKDGKLSLTEFLVALRGRVPLRRKKLIRQAYEQLDENRDGDISLREISEKYDAANHPAVLKGEKTVEQVMKDFMSTWDKDGDAIVSWNEFLTYYKDISSGIELDDYFELMIRNVWHLSGGEGWCANTTNRRVLVIHTDGSQSVEEVKNDLGIGPKDLEKIRARLVAQGITDIKDIQLTG